MYINLDICKYNLHAFFAFDGYSFFQSQPATSVNIVSNYHHHHLSYQSPFPCNDFEDSPIQRTPQKPANGHPMSPKKWTAVATNTLHRQNVNLHLFVSIHSRVAIDVRQLNYKSWGQTVNGPCRRDTQTCADDVMLFHTMYFFQFICKSTSCFHHCAAQAAVLKPKIKRS